jgi:type IV pilus assembly protein PilY1
MVVIMERTSKRTRVTIAAMLGVCGFIGPAASMAAEPGPLADVPLFLSNSADPNVLFLLDDSGSMDWGLMTTEYNGIMRIGCRSFYYTHPADGNEDTYIVPTEESHPGNGAWRAWNTAYNKLYYDPSVTYSPWSGEDKDGRVYANAPPTAAPDNPFIPNDGKTDLTATTSYLTRVCNDAGTASADLSVTGFYPAHYYTWTDTDGDGVVDADDGHTKVMIQLANAPFTGGPGRKDCAAAPLCTYAEEIQNFANWFSYYRKREHVAKFAFGQVIAAASNMRMGLGTLWDNQSVNLRIETMNEDPFSGEKGKLLESVYKMQGAGGTPLRKTFDDAGKYLSCQNNDLLDGCPALGVDVGGTCQQNFTILMTDGYYNYSFSADYGNADGDNSSPWDSGPTGPYGDPYGSGATEPTLGDIAMHYYETDLRPTTPNEVRPTPGGIDTNKAQHMVTYSVAFGVEGTVTAMPPNTTDPFAWPQVLTDPNKIDDLRHAGWNGRGDFLSAQNPGQLISGLRAALQSIANRKGSASAVAFNTGSLTTESVVYLALFDSERWGGDLLSYQLDPYTGAIDPTANWSAAGVLDARDLSADSRTILSYDGSDGIALQWDQLSNDIKNDLRTSPAGDTDVDALAMARLGYLRGDRACELASAGDCYYSDGVNTFTSKSLRERSTRLGDIVHSAPVFVGVPESNWPDVAPFPGTLGDTYTEFVKANENRSGVIYAGGNAGMLHGFSEKTGEELLAYVPGSLVSSGPDNGLHYLTDPAYTHRYGVDLTASVTDVYAKTKAGGSTSWKTVLVGGLRAGGTGLFALDVTNPSAFSETGSGPANTVMWEFTNADDPELGYTFSRPSIVPVKGSAGSLEWVVIFGNGYNGGVKGSLFILRLEGGLDGTWTEGTDYIKITTDQDTGLATPAVIDTDGDGLADRVYAGDLKGKLWAFDISSSNPSTWGVAHKDGGKPAPFFSGNSNQPITTTPVVVRNKYIPTSPSNAPNLMVIFGTGRYMVQDDITSNDTQAVYGVWDSGVGKMDRGDLIRQEFTLETTAGGDTVRTLSSNAVDYALKDGWYFELEERGERAVTDPVIRGDQVFVNSMMPDPNPCNFGGQSWLIVADWIDGSATDVVTFDVNRDGLLNDDDKASGNTVSGIKISGIATSPVNLGNKRYIPTNDTSGAATIEVTDIVKLGGPKTGRLSWEELNP